MNPKKKILECDKSIKTLERIQKNLPEGVSVSDLIVKFKNTRDLEANKIGRRNSNSSGKFQDKK